MRQIELIQRAEWDHLIILDAARYDCFEEQYNEHLKGGLIKAISEGSNTVTWLKNTWRGEYDLTYFSGNPYINSVGFPVDATKDVYVAKDRFKEIVDVWDFGWSERLETVHPRDMNEAVLNHDFDGSTIIHYVQPHSPYIGGETKYSIATSKIRSKVLKKRLREKRFKGPPRHLFKEIYCENLELVLSFVAEIVPCLEGRIVVSSDHGEFLGENGLWGKHPPYVDHPALREVPWFEVEK